MCERRTVAEANERMHYRGRVDDHLDAVVVDTEQEMCLDQLESFVGESRQSPL